VSGKITGATNNQPPATAAGSVGQRAAASASSAPNGATATANATTTPTTTVTGNANANAASATESVQITDTASHLVTAEQALNDVPVINPGRVAQARESLASGTYRISAERISNQLLQFERLLPEESVE
jgi:flagellar biosynthesis anti-sigma factor FlgM